MRLNPERVPEQRPPHPQRASDAEAAECTRQRLRQLPMEVGIVLVSVGLAGVALPVLWGTPFLLAGGLVLAPRKFARMERWVQRRWPAAHEAGRSVVDRFIADYEARFPN